jgi:hypothetical protein
MALTWSSSQEGGLLGPGRLVRGRLRERCGSGRGDSPRNIPQTISTIRHGARRACTRDETGRGLGDREIRLGEQLVYVSAVMVIEEWPSISWMSFRSVPASWERVAAPFGCGPSTVPCWRPPTLTQ